MKRNVNSSSHQSHTKMRYDECFAKIVLERFFPNAYNDLLLSDRPDLRDNKKSIGIEVTSSMSSDCQEALALACKIPSMSNEKRNKQISYLKKKGYVYTEYMMTHPTRCYEWKCSEYPNIEDTPCGEIFKAVTKKLNKLNSGLYAPMNRYDLFIFADDVYIDEWMPSEVVKKLNTLSSNILNYTVIYLLVMNGIYAFNTILQRWEFWNTEGKLCELGDLAKQMVKDNERRGPDQRMDPAAFIDRNLGETDK